MQTQHNDTWAAALVTVLCTVGVIGTIGVVGSFDYADQLSIEAEEKVARPQRAKRRIYREGEQRAANYAGIITACANGLPFKIGHDTVVQCFPIDVPPFKARRVDPRLELATGRP